MRIVGRYLRDCSGMPQYLRKLKQVAFANFVNRFKEEYAVLNFLNLKKNFGHCFTIGYQIFFLYPNP